MMLLNWKTCSLRYRCYIGTTPRWRQFPFANNGSLALYDYVHTWPRRWLLLRCMERTALCLDHALLVVTCADSPISSHCCMKKYLSYNHIPTLSRSISVSISRSNGIYKTINERQQNPIHVLYILTLYYDKQPTIWQLCVRASLAKTLASTHGKHISKVRGVNTYLIEDRFLSIVTHSVPIPSPSHHPTEERLCGFQVDENDHVSLVLRSC